MEPEDLRVNGASCGTPEPVASVTIRSHRMTASSDRVVGYWTRPSGLSVVLQRSAHVGRHARDERAALGVLTGQVGQAGDRWASSGRSVGPVMVVLVEPSWECCSAG